MYRNFLTTILNVLFLSIFFTECSDDQINGSAPYSLSSLTQLIEEAEDLVENSVEGYLIGHYPIGSQEILNNEISKAQDVLASTDQNEIDESTQTLTKAISTYSSSVITEENIGFSNLRDSTFISLVSSGMINQYITTLGLTDVLSGVDLLDVKAYKIEYKTSNTEGTDLIASGLVVTPTEGGDLPLFSYQHGTIWSYDMAPSEFDKNTEATILASIFASSGFIAVLPDYIGYGSSSAYPHPYEHSESLGSSCYDMIVAAQELLQLLSISWNSQLFITGYSEGGNATMALHQHIEAHSSIKVTMSAPGAGAYNKSLFLDYIINADEDLPFLKVYLWVLDTYDGIYGLDRDKKEYFAEPHATTIAKLTDPFDYPNLDVPINPQVLFNPNFISGLKDGTDVDFLDAIAQNDNFNWSPRYPITLYYGDADQYVIPENSETAYEAILENGGDIKRVIFEGKNHFTANIPYITTVFEQFYTMKN